jgi:TMEM175 potassium channel family protein
MSESMNKSKQKNRKTPILRPAVRKDEQFDDKLGLERILFFSDAVFAIAITLLVLEIRLPTSSSVHSDASLGILLTEMWQHYMAYLISFLVIGTFWIAHHRKFRYIRRYDGKLIWLNLLFLLFTAFSPFPSSIISEYSGRTATIFYATAMLLASTSLTGLWWYASRHNRLIDPDMDENQRQRQFIAPLFTSGVFILSIGIAFINPNLAKLSWLLILFSTMVVNIGSKSAEI